MEYKNISLTVFCRGRNGNPNDLTFKVEGQGTEIPAATRIHIEYYDSARDLHFSSEIENVIRSGLRTYNDTLNTNDVTLASVRNIREPFITRFGWKAGTRLNCKFRILDDGTHVFKL